MNLKGTGVAMVTPFNSDFTVDYKALKKLTRYLIDGGVDYLVVQGTTGETATLNKSEKKEVLACVVKENDGELPIVLGIGGNNTNEVCELLSDDLKSQGVDAILSVSPYYSKPSQEGIYQHFKKVSSSTELPIILYNVPGRTGSNMLPETTLRLAEIDNIIAIKEASGNMEQIMEIVANKPLDFLVISGDDPLVFPLIATGVDGVISVIGNAFPAQFSLMVKSALAGEYTLARKLHYACLPIIPLLFKEGNPAGVKEVLKQLDVCGNDVRLPLVKASKQLSEALKLAKESLLRTAI